METMSMPFCKPNAILRTRCNSVPQMPFRDPDAIPFLKGLVVAGNRNGTANLASGQYLCGSLNCTVNKGM